MTQSIEAPDSDTAIRPDRDAWAVLRAAQGRATAADPHETAILLPYQVAIERACERHDVVVVEKSRRTGATWGAAAGAVLRSGAARGQGGMDTLYMGTSADMAKEFIDAAAQWARLFDKAITAQGDELFDDGSDDGIKATRIDFASGFSIVALSSRPRSLRGRQGFAILDEAAFVDNLRALLQAALAFLIWGGKVLIISTHNGDQNVFNQLVTDVRAGRRPYGLVRFDLDQALEQGLYERICLVTKKDAWTPEHEADWRDGLIKQYGDGADEELYCIPSAGGGVVLPRVLIEARRNEAVPVLRYEQPTSFAMMPEDVRRLATTGWCAEHLAPALAACDPHLQHALGEDFGRVADLTVLWPLAIGKNLARRTPFVVELRNIPFEQQRQVLFYVADRLPRLHAMKLDAGGNGAYLAEVAAQRYGELRVEQVKLSQGWYLENVPPLKAAFEDAMIDVPADADIVTDLATPVYKAGIASIPPLRTAGADGAKRHADSFVAAVLAYAASRADPETYEYLPVSELDATGPFGRLVEGGGGRGLW